MDTTPAQRDEALAMFRATYGKLCRLAAHALHIGQYHRDAVYLATLGRSASRDTTLRALERQRRLVDAARTVAHNAGWGMADLAQNALSVRGILEGEWGDKIPVRLSTSG